MVGDFSDKLIVLAKEAKTPHVDALKKDLDDIITEQWPKRLAAVQHFKGNRESRCEESRYIS